MKIKVERTEILNRAWIYDDPDGDPIATTDFEVPREWLEKVFPILFPDEDNLDDFLNWYEPEEDGEKIYQKAKEDNIIIQEGMVAVDEIAPWPEESNAFVAVSINLNNTH